MIYQFNEFQLSPSNFSLLKKGQALDVEPQVFNLIQYLIENRERVVTRDEIFEVLWADKEVLDATLSNHIKLARAILGDDGKSQSIIRTVRGRGYQFVSEVKQLTGKTNSPSTRQLNWRHAVALMLFITSLLFMYSLNTQNSNNQQNFVIGVLPFLNSKPNPATDYLGLAIADQIIGHLSYITNINVRPSSVVRKYNSQALDPETIGKQLNVDFVLTGTYLNIDNKVLFNIELVEVETGKLFWREDNLEFDFSAPENLNNDIAQEVSKKLGLKNKFIQHKQLVKKNSQSTLAYKLYLKSISQPFSTEGNKRAIALLKESISIDENFAPAYSQLGNRIRRYEQYSLKNSGESQKSYQYYQKALAINDKLLSALSYLAFYYCETNQIDEALALANRIIQINPESANSYFTLGYVYRYAGLIEEAINQMEKAINVDPKNIRYRSLVATYSGARKFTKAQQLVDSYEETSFTLGWDGLIAYRIGDYKLSLIHFERLINKDPDGLWGLVAKIYMHHLKGEREKGLLIIHQLEQTNITDSETVYYTAVYYAMYQDKKRSLNALKKAVEGGYYNYIFMQNSEFFDFLRDDSEFINLVAIAHSKSSKFRTRL